MCRSLACAVACVAMGYTQCNMQGIILWFQMLFGWQACSLACEPPNVHLQILFY